jgi:hypothetical protein
MSVDLLYLLHVRPEDVVGHDDFLGVDDAWKGDDYVVMLGDRWNPRWASDAALQRALALALTEEHWRALVRAPAPRDVLVLPDAGAPDRSSRDYAEVRATWLRSGAVRLPDVLDEIVDAKRTMLATRPLAPADVRIPLPDGTKRARLRRLDPAFAIQQIEQRPCGALRAAGWRAGVVLADVAADVDALRRFYAREMKAIGLRVKDERSKYIEETFFQLVGRAEGLLVSVYGAPSTEPRAAGLTAVGVTWAEKPPPLRPARSGAARSSASPPERPRRATTPTAAPAAPRAAPRARPPLSAAESTPTRRRPKRRTRRSPPRGS